MILLIGRKKNKFRKVRNDFQMKFCEDLRKVHSLKKTLTFEDKTSNMYRLKKEEYRRILPNVVTITIKSPTKKQKEG